MNDGEKKFFPARVPKKMAKLLHDNHSLKVLALGAYIVCFLAITMAITSSFRRPIILPLDKNGERVKVLSKEVWSEDQVQEGVKDYLDSRYSWNPKNQADHLYITRKFISDGSRSAFDKTVTELLQFSKGKAVSQRVYPVDVKVDMEHGFAHVVADRINEIQGLKAASLLNVKLYFEHGKSSLENPWGFYVTKEEEIVSQ